MTARRLSSGGLIDRTKVLRFRFDGRDYTGHPGDTLASALLASGVRIMGRSFKYHRPRGVWGAWFDDPGAIFNVALNGIELPNCPATTTPLIDGMEARAVNAWPSAERDIKGALDLFHRVLPAGFYYKTFMWPDWHLFEPSIRKMAGLGSVDGQTLEGFQTDQIHAHCDLLVVGGGLAGLAAARAVAEAGQHVVVVEDHPEAGGSAYQLAQIEGQSPERWVADTVDAINVAGGEVITNATAYGVYDHQLVAIAQDRGFGVAPRLIRMRATKCLLASGALDRPLTFANNDRPGVMSLSGAVEFLSRYGVLVGDQVAVMASHCLAHAQIKSLEAAGVRLRVIDPGTDLPRALSGKYLSALEIRGDLHPCDTILTSAGLTPVLHLWSHAGGKLIWDETFATFLPGTGPDWIEVIGAAAGTFDADDALAEARAKACGGPAPSRRYSYSATPPEAHLGSRHRQWIDLQHDVTLDDIELAARENYVSVEHLKRYTTLGMASDQGKTSNIAGLSAMAALQGKSIPEVGTTTFRPPFVPIPLELYHGAHRTQQNRPLKRLPLEPQHRAANAALGEYGGWVRPGWYGGGDPQVEVQREALQARETAGIFDASPLGKIEVMGPDAEAFVNFVYYNTINTLKPGHIRYGFMLTEQGVVYDDGVITRIDENRFIISCSSSHVDGVYAHLEAWRQDGNDPDRIFVHDTTQNWATLALTGPKARAILSKVDLGIDLSNNAFPHMQMRTGTFERYPVRVARVSFTGDTSFEISIRADAAVTLWDALSSHANPIGIEAISILRAEKGYLIIGKDTDGESMPHDLGFGASRTKKSAAFVGDRGLHTEKANGPNRKRLVGFEVSDGAAPLPTGAHVVTRSDGKQITRGFVSSSYQSPNLNRPIALGLVDQRIPEGTQVELFHLGKYLTATLCAACVFDPEGERLHAE